MPEVADLASVKPHLPTMTPRPSSSTLAALTSSSSSSITISTTLLPWEELHMQVHTILIIVIFCGVCLLMLLAFTYAFCLHCSIRRSSPKDSHRATTCSLDREDATYRRSSSDSQSVGNTV